MSIAGLADKVWVVDGPEVPDEGSDALVIVVVKEFDTFEALDLVSRFGTASTSFAFPPSFEMILFRCLKPRSQASDAEKSNIPLGSISAFTSFAQL